MGGLHLWQEDSASVVVLPSGTWSEELLRVAEQWSAAWLLAPAFWVLADDLLLSDHYEQAQREAEDALERRRPPRIRAYVLGRDDEGNPSRQEVELFWALGAREFRLLRLVAIRTEQSGVERERTAVAAKLAKMYLDAARPMPKERSQGAIDGTEFLSLNVIIGKTLQTSAGTELVEMDWNANIVAAPEDSPTPLSTDAFVLEEHRYLGFALVHIATAAGLWSGLPKSSYELSEIYPHPGSARFQRVFARAVASDTLALDLALSALKRASEPDRLNSLSIDPNYPVVATATHRIDQVRAALVDFMLDGPGTSTDGEVSGFRYQRLPFRSSEADHTSFWRVMVLRLKDSIEALIYLPRWFRYLAQQRMLASTGDASDQLLQNALPKRLFARFEADGLPNPNSDALPSLRPHPELWAHVRKALMAAVDGPRSVESPDPLVAQDGSHMFFSSLDDVLPRPDSEWDGAAHAAKTSALLGRVGWLDVAACSAQQDLLRVRQTELAPVVQAAAEHAQSDRAYLEDFRQREHMLVREAKHAQREYQEDLAYAVKMRGEHPHGMTAAEAGPARKPVGQGSPIRLPIDIESLEDSGDAATADEQFDHPQDCPCERCTTLEGESS